MRVAFPMAGKSGGRGNPDLASPSGSTLSTLILAQGLKECGIDPVIILHNDGSTVDYVERMGLTAVVINAPFFDKRKKITDEKLEDLFQYMESIEKKIKPLGIIAIHTNDAHMHRTWGYICEKLNVGHIWHERGLFKHPEKSMEHLRNAVKIISISDYVTQLAPEDVQERVVTIPNPITVSNKANKKIDRSWLRDLLEIPPNSKVLVMVANENSRKRWEIFFEAASKASEQRKDLHFCALGLKDEEFIQSMIENNWSNPDKSQFHSLGYRTDAWRIMSGSDVVVATAKNEPLGRTIVESLLVNTPLLAANSGGHIEILENIAPYCLVNPDNVEEFTKRFLEIDQLINSYEKNKEEVHKTLKIKFKPETHVERIISLYNEVEISTPPRGVLSFIYKIFKIGNK